MPEKGIGNQSWAWEAVESLSERCQQPARMGCSTRSPLAEPGGKAERTGWLAAGPVAVAGKLPTEPVAAVVAAAAGGELAVAAVVASAPVVGALAAAGADPKGPATSPFPAAGPCTQLAAPASSARMLPVVQVELAERHTAVGSTGCHQ